MTDPALSDRAHPARWRVGRRVPKNVYVNDEVAGQFQREEWARQAVSAVNDGEEHERLLVLTERQRVVLSRLYVVLSRLARLADALRERTGEQPPPMRDYAADLDVVEAALPVTESEIEGGEECASS